MRSATDVWPGRTRQQLGRARPQPHGSSLPRRRARARSRAWTTSTTTAAAPTASTSRATAICSATSATICAASATRAARAATAGRARWPSWASAAQFKDETAQPGAWTIGATAFGEMLPNHANTVSLDRDEEGQVGPAGAQDRLRDGRERAPDAQGHDQRHGRDARRSPA